MAKEKKKQVPPDPIPGSPEKVDLIRQRASCRDDLFQAGDVISDPTRRLNTHRLRNGRDRIDQEQPVVGVEGRETGEIIIRRRMAKSPARIVSLVVQGRMKIGERLHQLRLRRKVSQGQVALETGLSQAQISRLEDGQYRDGLASSLWVLADYFKVSIDWLAGRTDERRRT